MILTYKAIAMMCGFRVETAYTCFPNTSFAKELDDYSWWERPSGKRGTPFFTAEDAWKDCCIANGLVQEE